MSYSTVFGANTILPTQSSYSSYSFDTDLSLTWPTESGSGANIASMIIDLMPASSGLSVTLDTALIVSVGQTIVFNNKSADSVTIKNNIGNTVMVLTAGTIWTAYLTDNTSAAGTWTVFQNGAGTSTATAASMVGYGLKAISATLNQNMSVSDFSGSYTAGAADRASVLNWTGGAGTLDLPAASSLGNDWFLHVRNSGSGTLTLTPATGTINGAATLALATTDSCILVCNGTTYFTIGLGRSVTSTFNVLGIGVAGTGNYTLSAAEQGQIGYRFTGILTGNRSIIVPNSIAQYWVDNSTTGAYTLTVKTLAGTGIVVPNGSNRYILYCDGTNVVDADTASISTPVAIADGGTAATTAANARINLGGTSVGIQLFTAASAAAARTAIDAIQAQEAINYSVAMG
jgi:hypothetical protein